jgi:hypothetical protein
MPESIQQEAQAILNILASIPFQDCIAISKEFRELPMRAGIYAVKHRTLGILCIGSQAIAAISMKKLYPLSIASPSLTNDYARRDPFWNESKSA